MDSVGGPDAKKARWSPSSFNSNGLNGLNSAAARDAFANYGYGPQANMSQASYTSSSSPNGFSGSPLYTTPSLSINTSTGSNGMSSQMSPNTAGPFTPQTQQAPASANGGAAYGGFGGYNMLAMAMPGMGVLNGFPYNNQMGNFSQVRYTRYCCLCVRLIVLGIQPATSSVAHHPFPSSISLFARCAFCCHGCSRERHRSDRLCR
jgi:hypothetical protein